jgi:hypothetical protein
MIREPGYQGPLPEPAAYCARCDGSGVCPGCAGRACLCTDVASCEDDDGDHEACDECDDGRCPECEGG